MLTAKDIMSTNIISFTPDTPIAEAVKCLLEKGINGAPVLDDDKLVGMLCQSDLVATQKDISLPSVFTTLDVFIPLGTQHSFEEEIDKITAMTVGKAMTKSPVTVTPDTPLGQIAVIMTKNNYYTIPVVDAGEVAGIIGKADVLKTLVEDK